MKFSGLLPAMGKRNSYYRRLLLGILLLLLSSIFALGIFLYSNFNQAFIDIVNSSNSLVLSQITAILTERDQLARRFLDQLGYDPGILSLKTRLLDERATVQLLKASDKMVMNYPFIESVYVYNAKHDILYTLGSNVIHRTAEEFERTIDPEAVRILRNTRQASTSKPIPRSVYNPVLLREVDVYTYARIDAAPSEALASAVVLNIDVSHLFSNIQVTNLPNNLFVFTPERYTVCHSPSSLSQSEEERQAIQTAIIAAGSSSGYVIKAIDGEKCVISFATMASTGWFVANIIPYSVVLQSTSSLQSATILILGLVMLVSILGALLVAHVLYTPVRKTVAGLDDPRAEDDMRTVSWLSEFERISLTLEHNKKKLAEHLDTRYKSRLSVVSGFFSQQILHNQFDQSVFFDLCRRHSIRFYPSDAFTLTLLHVYPQAAFEQTHSREDRELYQYAILNVVHEVFADVCATEAFYIDPQSCVILCAWPAGCQAPEAIRTALFSCYQSIANLFTTHFRLSISCFVSSPYRFPEEFPVAYQQAKELSAYQFFQNTATLMFYQDFEHRVFQNIQARDVRTEPIMQALINGKLDELSEALDQLFAKLALCEYPVCQTLISYLSTSLLQTILLIEKNLSYTFGIDYIAFFNDLSRLESLLEVKSALLGLSKTVMDLQDNRRKNKNVFLCERMKTYIGENFCDCNLSSKSIADHVNLAPGYANKLFKAQYSQSIADYLSTIRLQCAVELLQNSSLTVEEITAQIGWINTKYFFQQFKAQYGITPMQYRNSKT